MSQLSFKRPTSIDPEERRQDRLISVMATQVRDQQMLDALLEGSNPLDRQQMMERLLPYLPFCPDECVTPDCPDCGLRRGSVIAHECHGAD